MIANYKEAVRKLAYETGYSEEYIIDNDLILEYLVEVGEEFSEWFDANGRQLEHGEPIGYSVCDATSESPIYPYHGLIER